MSNLDLWNKVEKTNPLHTKSANVRGNKITAIAPQTQIKNATEQFGSYGKTWGFKSIDFDYSMVSVNNVIVFKGVFFYPEGEFPIVSSIGAYMDKACKMPDQDFAKKAETDALTKALSKLGFNADVFMGLFDDHKYVQMMKDEFNRNPEVDAAIEMIDQAISTNDIEYIGSNWSGSIANVWQYLGEDRINKLNNMGG